MGELKGKTNIGSLVRGDGFRGSLHFFLVNGHSAPLVWFGVCGGLVFFGARWFNKGYGMAFLGFDTKGFTFSVIYVIRLALFLSIDNICQAGDSFKIPSDLPARFLLIGSCTSI